MKKVRIKTKSGKELYGELLSTHIAILDDSVFAVVVVQLESGFISSYNEVDYDISVIPNVS